jgi:uncharacterized membrane protein YqjE
MVERSMAETKAATLLDLLHRLTAQLSTLFHQEVKLAASELSGTLTALFVNLASVATGAAVLYAGFLLLLVAGVCGLATVVPLWLASLAVGLAVASVGCILVASGKQKLRVSELAPTRSAASLRRDKDVLTGKVS